MRECTIEQASITYRWVFDKILPLMPGPGTPTFAALCRKLQPYGISPLGITLDAPTSRLGDVILAIALLDESATLRLSYGWFELMVRGLSVNADDLESEYSTALINIVNETHAALREVDTDSRLGHAKVNCEAHISLPSLEHEAFLRDHLHPTEDIPDLTPDAFAYTIKGSNVSHIQESRVVITRSVVFPSAFFINLSMDYSALSDTAALAKQLVDDIERTLALLGLKSKNDSKEGDNL